MAAEKIEQLQLKSFEDLVKIFTRQNSFFKKQHLLTKKNPFKTMSDADWKIYVETHEPHFTSEPHYEVIPWEELQKLEIDAKTAGWELILRTTNNTAYCPGYVGQNWCQRTQWFFGLPNMQFLIHLTYNEDKWSLIEENNNNDLPPKNYFSLNVIATSKLKVREKTNEELAQELDYDSDYDYLRNYSSRVEYYDLPKPATGWVRNSGMIHNGTSQFEYIFEGSNVKYNSFLGLYTSTANKANDASDSKEKDTLKPEQNIMEQKIPASFWSEWIENNRDNIEPGKFSKVQITHWSDTYVLPGGQFNIDEVLQWDMDFRFLQKFMNSNISNWLEDIFGYNCCGTIRHDFWNIKIMGPLSDNPELFKKTCIIEAKKSDDDEWTPFDGYRDSLLQYKSIRLSENAHTLIEHIWKYVNLQNQ
jgi:hypothetical protein